MVIKISNIWLCEECDAVISKQPLQPGEKVYCPNCKHSIAEKSRYSFHIPFALSVTGLILLFPACTLPLIHMQMLVKITNYSIISGIADFIYQGMWIPAILIFLGAVASPFIYLLLCTLILIIHMSGIDQRYLIKMLKLFNYIKLWGMLEVYLLGIFIAIIKLNDVARVYPGFGLVSLVGLILCQTIITFTVKPRLLWSILEKDQTPKEKGSIL